METESRGRKKNQLMNRVLKALVEAHPASIYPKDSMSTVPLAIGVIDSLIAAHPEIERADLRTFISLYTQKSRYQRALVECTHRVDLAGAAVGIVNQVSRERAKNALAKREAIRTAAAANGAAQ